MILYSDTNIHKYAGHYLHLVLPLKFCDLGFNSKMRRESIVFQNSFQE